jgi:hypothetical protein
MTSNSVIINNAEQGDKPLLTETNSLNRFIKKYYNSDNYSHVGMDSQSGKYCFGMKIDKFYVKYLNQSVKHIAEKRGDYSQFVIDIDIKKTKEEYENQLWLDNKFYTIEQVKALIKVCQEQIKKIYFGIQDIQLDAVLLEKDIYQKNENTWSGGLHIQFPNLYVKTETIKNSLIPCISEELKKIDGMPKEFVVMDISAMCTAPWLLYGSTKSADSKPYLISKIFNYELQEMTVEKRLLEYKIYDTEEEPITLTSKNLDKNLPRILSINPGIRPVNEIKKKYDNPTPPVIKEKKEKKEYIDNRPLDERRNEVKKLLSCLKPYRADDLPEWMKVAWILWGISDGDDEFFDIWNEWSSQSEKYKDEDDCRKIWNSIKPRENGVTIGTLKAMAKEDNEQMYYDLMKIDDFCDLSLSLNETLCAHYFNKHNKDSFYYSNHLGWIVFNEKTRFWEIKEKDKYLLSVICGFFLHKFQITIDKLWNEEQIKGEDEEKKFQERVKLLGKNQQRAGSSAFGRNVLDQLSGIVEKTEDILSKFNSNPNLFCFRDGICVDLDEKLYDENSTEFVSRKIDKSDLVTMHCGYDFPKKKDSDYMKKVLDMFYELSDDKDQVESILSSCSIPLRSNNKHGLMFVFTGSGRNGKGVVAKCQKRVFGNYYQPIDPILLTTDKYDNFAYGQLAKTVYAKVIMSTEPEDKGDKVISFNTSRIKKLTGGDELSAKLLFNDPFDFTAKFIPFNQCNNIPDLSVNDMALKLRMKCILLPFRFITSDAELQPGEKRGDPTLKDKIESDDEFRAALFHVFEKTFLKHQGKFYESAETIQYTQSYFNEQEPFKDWFFQNYKIELKDIKARIQAKNIVTHFKNAGLDITMSPNGINNKLDEFCPHVKSGGRKFYKCVRIQNDFLYDNSEIPEM